MNISILGSLQTPVYSSTPQQPIPVWKSTDLRTSSPVPLSFRAMNSMINAIIINASSSREWQSMKKFRTTSNYFEDPEILLMSEDEIKVAVLAAFGAWADREDITDDWLDDLRRGWSDRLDDLYSE